METNDAARLIEQKCQAMQREGAKVLGPDYLVGPKPRSGEILGDPLSDPDPLIAIPVEQAVANVQANRTRSRQLMPELQAAKAAYEKLDQERKDLIKKWQRDERVLLYSVNNPV